MPRKAEIQTEEASVTSSPLRRSNRIGVSNTSAPVTLSSGRNSQAENTETKSAKTTRSSLLQENGQQDEKVESKSAPRGRRASAAKEELQQKPEPAKTRSRRSSATSEPPEPEQKKQPITRHLKSVEDQTEEIPKSIRSRRGSSVDKTVEDTTKKPVRARRSSAKEEETNEESVKRSVRGRRNSTDKAVEPEVEVKKPKGRRPSMEKLEGEPEIKVTKLTPAKTKRRLSITENATNLEPIIEQDSEQKGGSNISPQLKQSILVLTPIKMSKPTDVKANLDLSVIDEDPLNETKPEEKVVTPRKSLRLNKDKSPPLRKSLRLVREENGVQKTGLNKENSQETVERSEPMSYEQEEDDVFEETTGKKKPQEKKSSPRKKKLNFEPEEVKARQSVGDNSQKEETTPKEGPHISPGSDGSFRFHLNTSLPSSNSQNDVEEVEDLNSSKNSNSSNKENEAIPSNQVPDIKRDILEDKQAALQNMLNNNTGDKSKDGKVEQTVVARISDVFRPRMRENSFFEPMEVDEFSLSPQKVPVNSKIETVSPVVSTPIESRNSKQLVNDNKTIVDETVDESFKLRLSSQEDEDVMDKSAVTDDSEIMTYKEQKKNQENSLQDTNTSESQDPENSAQAPETIEEITGEDLNQLDATGIKEVEQADISEEQSEETVQEEEGEKLLKLNEEDDAEGKKGSPRQSKELQTITVLDPKEEEVKKPSETESQELSSEVEELKQPQSPKKIEEEQEDLNILENTERTELPQTYSSLEQPKQHVKETELDIQQIKSSPTKSEEIESLEEEEVKREVPVTEKEELREPKKAPTECENSDQQIAVDESKENTISTSRDPQVLKTNKLAPKKELLRRSKSPQQRVEEDLELDKTQDKNHLEERKSESLLPEKSISVDLALKNEQISASKSTSLSSKDIQEEEKASPKVTESEKEINIMVEPVSASSPVKELRETEKEKIKATEENNETDCYTFELPSDEDLEESHCKDAEGNISGTEKIVPKDAQAGPLKRKSLDSEQGQKKKVKLTPEKSKQNSIGVDACKDTLQVAVLIAVIDSSADEEAIAQERYNDELVSEESAEITLSPEDAEPDERLEYIPLPPKRKKLNAGLVGTVLEVNYNQMASDFKDEVESYRVVQEEESGNLRVSVLETKMNTGRNNSHVDEDSKEEHIASDSQEVQELGNKNMATEKTSIDEEKLIEISDTELNGKSSEEEINLNGNVDQENPKKKKQQPQPPIEGEDVVSGEKEEIKIEKQRQSRSNEVIAEPNSEKKIEDNASKEVNARKKYSRLEGLEEFATSKLDDFLSKQLSDRDDTDDSYQCTSDEEDDKDTNEFIYSMAEEGEDTNEFIYSMAEEGEEDTPSEGSNDIIEVGESIHSNSERESEDDYDEDDSFICDDEKEELLSGEEYDLEEDKKSKGKKSRIIKLDNFEDDVIKIEKKERPVKEKKKSRIIHVVDSSDEEKVEEKSESPEVPVQIEVEDQDSCNKSHEIVEDERPRKKKSSITIHENICVSAIQDTVLSERITHLVDTFCTTIRKGEISMNLSLEHAVKCSSKESLEATSAKTPRKSMQQSPVSSNAEENLFVKKTKQNKSLKDSDNESDKSIESFEDLKTKKTLDSAVGRLDRDEDMVFVKEESKKKKRIKRKKSSRERVFNVGSAEAGECSSGKTADRLSVTLDSVEDLGGAKKRTAKKRRLSKSLDDLGNLESKNKKKKKRSRKHLSSEDDLQTQTFGIMNQLITDVKNRPVRTIKPSVVQADMSGTWICEVADERPSTSIVSKREKLEYKAGTHPKDFRNQMLYNSSRVKRVDTKKLLKKKGAYF